MPRPWTKVEVNKIEAQLLALGTGNTNRIWRRAELQSTRELAEVHELEAALTLLIYRVGGIEKAQYERSAKSHRSMMDLDRDIPMEVSPFCTYGVEAGYCKYYAHIDREAHKQLSPRSKGLAVWADAELITDEIKEQLPTSTHRALLAGSTIKHLEADGGIMLQQLEERKALAQLMAAVDADDPAAKSRLLSLSKFSPFHNPPDMCPWWKPKDNETLLREYHKRGVYLHKRHRELLRFFAEGLLLHSKSCVDFSVEIGYDSFAGYDFSTNTHIATSDHKRIVYYGERQWEACKGFLTRRLTLLMEGVMNPLMVESQLAQQSGDIKMLEKYYLGRADRSEADDSHADEDGEDNIATDRVGPDDSGAEASDTGNTSSDAEQDVEDEVHSHSHPQLRDHEQAAISQEQPSKRARTDAGANAQSHCTYGAHPSDHAPQRRQDTSAYSSAAEQDNSAAYGQYTDASFLGRGMCNEGKDAIEQVRGAAHAVLPMLSMPGSNLQAGGVVSAAVSQQHQQPGGGVTLQQHHQPNMPAMPQQHHQPRANAAAQQNQQPSVPAMPQQHQQPSGGMLSRPQGSAAIMDTSTGRGFTEGMLNVLRCQIIAHRCMKSGHKVLPPALMQAIKPSSVPAQAAQPVASAPSNTRAETVQSAKPAVSTAHPAASHTASTSAAHPPLAAAATATAALQPHVSLLASNFAAQGSMPTMPPTYSAAVHTALSSAAQAPSNTAAVNPTAALQPCVSLSPCTSMLPPAGLSNAAEARRQQQAGHHVQQQHEQYQQQHQQQQQARQPLLLVQQQQLSQPLLSAQLQQQQLQNIASLLQHHQLSAAMAAVQCQQQTVVVANYRLQWETANLNQQQNLINTYMQQQFGHTHQQHCAIVMPPISSSVRVHQPGASTITQGSKAISNKENTDV